VLFKVQDELAKQVSVRATKWLTKSNSHCMMARRQEPDVIEQ